MASCKHYQYYVEGECEKKLLTVLKEQGSLIIPGKIEVMNVIQNEIPDAKLMLLPPKVTVILVFDTDKDSADILQLNINKLLRMDHIEEVWCVTQVPDFESELVRATSLRSILKLYDCSGMSEFKELFIKDKNLYKRLCGYKFDLNLMWSSKASGVYEKVTNNGARIKK